MTEQEKLRLLEDTMEVDEGTLSAEMSLDSIDEYDSMTKLSLIVMIEDEFGKKLTSNDIKALKTVGDVLEVMG